MNPTKLSKKTVLTLLLILIPVGQALFSFEGFVRHMVNAYPWIKGTKLEDCSTCHSEGFSLNTYGWDFLNSGYNFKKLDDLDSDGDGFSNRDEIKAGTYPGDASDNPISSY